MHNESLMTRLKEAKTLNDALVILDQEYKPFVDEKTYAQAISDVAKLFVDDRPKGELVSHSPLRKSGVGYSLIFTALAMLTTWMSFSLSHSLAPALAGEGISKSLVWMAFMMTLSILILVLVALEGSGKTSRSLSRKMIQGCSTISMIAIVFTWIAGTSSNPFNLLILMMISVILNKILILCWAVTSVIFILTFIYRCDFYLRER